MDYMPPETPGRNRRRRTRMRLIQRYLFRQLALSVTAACGALIGIGILSQSLDQLEIIVERGQSAVTMAKLTLMATPQLLSLILPIGLLVGSLVALSRLQRENELTAAQAAGMSRWALISPAVRLAVITAVVALAVNLFVQPGAQREARRTAFEIRTDLAALLVEEGRFVQGPNGITVYAQQIEQNGLITNLFVYLRDGEETTTWNAGRARFTRIENQPYLILQNGSMQQYSSRGVLNHFAFEEYPFDLTPFADTDQTVRFKDSDLWLPELLNPSAEHLERAGSRAELLAEAHARFSSPLYALTAMALALFAIVGGKFRRGGYGRRIALAAGLFLVARVAGYGVVAASAWNPGMIPFQYLIPLGVAAWAMRPVISGRPRRSKRARLAAKLGLTTRLRTAS